MVLLLTLANLSDRRSDESCTDPD